MRRPPRPSVRGRLTAAAFVALAHLPQDAAWKRVEPGIALSFPADHGSHPEYRTEWWYLTGQLEDDSGARFGFQFTAFRRGLEPSVAPEGASPLRARAAWAGHLTLTDIARGETRFAERLRRSSPLAGAAESELDLRLDDWSLARVPGAGTSEELRLVASDPAHAFGYDFTLRPQKPLVLQGQRGYSQKGSDPGNASAYVSWTRLALTGTLDLDGRRRTVRGTAWYDHEFGSSVLADGAVGWDWFGLQLDDGRELMLFVLRDVGGTVLDTSAATLVAADGSTRTLARAEFTLRSTTSWKSPRTATTYPAEWTILIPSASLELHIQALVADCELVSQASTGISYWEGPVGVRGSSTGTGYAELTGYGASMAERF